MFEIRNQEIKTEIVNNFKNKKIILLVYGTRPEIIKLFILYKILKNSAEFFPLLVNTGQQKISGDIMQHLNLKADIECNVIKNRTPDLNGFISHILNEFNDKFSEIKSLINRNSISGIMVQGDTVSAYTGAIWGFTNKIPVFHIEAGLRTFDQVNPFPEEFFRESIARASSVNFCPTNISYDNLVKEGIDPKKNYIVGNTVNDAIITLLNENKIKESDEKDYILSTLHRRENWDSVRDYARILNNILKNGKSDKKILHLIHPNPIVKDAFEKEFSGGIPENLVLREPIHDYLEMLGTVKNSHTILTDSGGIQEESLFFNIPCGIMRKVTERPEVLSKNAKLLPFSDIQVYNFLSDAEDYRINNTEEFDYTYGKGNTSEMIYDVMKIFYNL